MSGWKIMGWFKKDGDWWKEGGTPVGEKPVGALDIAHEALDLLEEAHDHRVRKMHVGRDWDDWEERIVMSFLAKHRAEEKERPLPGRPKGSRATEYRCPLTKETK